MAKFTEWQKKSAELRLVQEWLAHIGRHGRESDVLRISPAHCRSPAFTIAGQYSTGGKNYWESPDQFNEAMKAVILKRFKELAEEAVSALEGEAATTLVAAECEVKTIQLAIDEAKRPALQPAAPSLETDPRSSELA